MLNRKDVDRMFKKLTALLLAVFLTALCACSRNEHTALTVAGAELNTGIYSYYLDTVNSFPTDYDIVTVEDSVIIEKARELCTRYVAIETIYSELMNGGVDLTLTTEEKGEVSDSANSLWRLMQTYYEEKGIEKKHITQIKTNEMKLRRLLHYYFDTDGEFPTTEAEIKKYFDANYVSFKSVNGYLTDTDAQGNSYILTGDNKLLIEEKFKKMLENVKNGTPIETVDDSASADEIFISKDNSAFPSGFFDFVAGLDYETPDIFESDENIFLVQRTDADSGENSYYDNLRSDCLNALKGSFLETLLETRSADYVVTADEKYAAKCEKIVLR